MIPEIRERYNQQFTQEAYSAFLQDLHRQFDHTPGFRIAETPVFIPAELRDKLLFACERIVDTITRLDFKTLTEPSLGNSYRVPNEDAHTTFLQIDFGLCEGEDGDVVPKLIEVQGFPSLYFYQHYLARLYREHFDFPQDLRHLFNGFTPDTFKELMRNVIVGDADPKEVVLIDVDPWQQNTQIDFYATRKELGIRVAAVTDLFRKGDQLFYKNESGHDVPIRRIYNRVIFDELVNRHDLNLNFKFTDELDVYWVGHPNWFFRISKFTMPFLRAAAVPKTYFLDQVAEIPEDLSGYVLKPLYSFSGSGVIFDVKREDIDAVKDRTQFILQEKVKYVPVIKTPDNDPVKLEVRMMLVWPEGDERPTIVTNLIRMSKGVMIGVKYNKDKTWVGSSVGFFPPQE